MDKLGTSALIHCPSFGSKRSGRTHPPIAVVQTIEVLNSFAVIVTKPGCGFAKPATVDGVDWFCPFMHVSATLPHGSNVGIRMLSSGPL